MKLGETKRNFSVDETKRNEISRNILFRETCEISRNWWWISFSFVFRETKKTCETGNPNTAYCLRLWYVVSTHVSSILKLFKATGDRLYSRVVTKFRDTKFLICFVNFLRNFLTTLLYSTFHYLENYISVIFDFLRRIQYWSSRTLLVIYCKWIRKMV
jgi:hypothetical protein